MIKFEKVSLEEYAKAVKNCFGDMYSQEEIVRQWENIKLPQRATKGSAGYDFFLPLPLMLDAVESTTFPTGIRCTMPENVVLMLYPRSGLGFKYGMHLANTVGVIDSDYYNADNEGHIQAKFSLDHSVAGALSSVFLEPGKAFMQGVFVKYEVTDDDAADGIRNGGFGSTDETN